MVETGLTQKITEQVKRLSPADQRRVLDFVRALAVTQPKGTSGKDLIALAASLEFDKEDLREMARAIEEDCERVDADGW